MRSIWTNWNAVDEIESLRNDGVPLDEIEEKLLSGRLGEIYSNNSGYQEIGSRLLSHLVIEIHNPGFTECIANHPWKYVVHHKDGNKLNNVFTNLKVMSRSKHSKMHADTYWDDSRNFLNMKEEENWLPSGLLPEFFESWFTIKEYAELRGMSYDIASRKLDALSCESKVIDGQKCYTFKAL